MPIVETKFGIFYILTLLYWNIVMDDLNLDKIHLVSDNNYNFINLQSLVGFTKEWQIMLGFTFCVDDTPLVVYN